MTKRTFESGARVLAFFALVALLAAAPIAAAQRGGRRAVQRQERADDARDRVAEVMTGWTRLGERWIEGGARPDRDTIMVTAREGTFRQLALRVEHSSIELFDLVVTFGDGSTINVPTRLVFTPATATRTVDLPGDSRFIRRIDFRAANLPGGGRAQVELWAR